MPFTIPNFVHGATYPALSEPDSVDFDALVSGCNQTGVLTGCAVTAQGSPNMTVAVARGAVASAGVSAAVTAGNVTITTADATNPRFDLVVASSSGVLSAVAGTPLPSNGVTNGVAEEAVFPLIPAGSILLAAIYVPATATTISAAQITDKRVVVVLASSFAGSSGFSIVPTTDQTYDIGAPGLRWRRAYAGSLSIGSGLAPTAGVDVLGGGFLIRPLVSTTGVTVAVVGAAGTVSYEYWVFAIDAFGNETQIGPNDYTLAGNGTLNGTNYNRITWTATPGAYTYGLYRRVTGTSNVDSGRVTLTIPSSATSFNDIGIAAINSVGFPLINTTGQFRLGAGAALSSPDADGSYGNQHNVRVDGTLAIRSAMLFVGDNGTTTAGISVNNPPYGLKLASTGSVAWSSGDGTATTYQMWVDGFDTILYRDSAGVIAQRNSANPQVFRIYNTWTDDSNYERLGTSWASDIITITPEAFGTGTVRGMTLGAVTGAGMGFYGHAPAARTSAAAAATDLVSAIALANNIRTALQSNGMMG